ncbi:MAG TPA: hypothetical protein K8U77_04555, partial [Slackia equolifaciens]|nr:hypothetical protein [Slackia equolifaciens]
GAFHAIRFAPAKSCKKVAQGSKDKGKPLIYEAVCPYCQMLPWHTNMMRCMNDAPPLQRGVSPIDLVFYQVVRKLKSLDTARGQHDLRLVAFGVLF